MDQAIKVGDVYDKNINFLIGSGASTGFLPTLALKIKDEGGRPHTIESLSTLWGREGKYELRTLLFMYYYTECIKPAIGIKEEELTPKQLEVFENYAVFLKTVLLTINRSQTSSRKCNIFTTNYDNCLEIAADKIIEENELDFILNDGCRGFMQRYLHAKNLNAHTYQTGIFGKHRSGISQINLIHLHGSIFWKNSSNNITVNYSNSGAMHLLPEECLHDLEAFSSILNNPESTIDQFEALELNEISAEEFWDSYNKLPIVNPTKWKFYETVFEEHYYQMLRFMSYELEKENSVLITFGFSFADEHIRHLIQRSLSNPSLQLYICCFNDDEKEEMRNQFKGYVNVDFITVDGGLDFKAFNAQVFSMAPASQIKNEGSGES